MTKRVQAKKQGKRATRRNRRPTKKAKKQTVVRVVRTYADAGMKRLTLTECSSRYLHALRYPFDDKAIGACLPYPPTRESLKATTTIRFTGLTGTNQMVMYVLPTLASDRACVYYKTAATGAYPPDALTLTADNTAPAGWIGSAMSTLPATAAQLASQSAAGRIVAFGIRVSFAGESQYTGGTLSVYAHPEHENVNGYNPGAFANVPLWRITDKQLTFGFGSVSDKEREYAGYQTGYFGTVSYLYPWSRMNVNGASWVSAPTILDGSPVIQLVFSNLTANQRFMVELIQHTEYVGSQFQYGCTPSHADHNGASLVDEAAQRAQSDGSYIDFAKKIGNKLREAAHDQGFGMVDTVSIAAKAATVATKLYRRNRPSGGLALLR